MPRHIYNLLNDSSANRTLFIEPWGEELLMPPGMHLQLGSSLPMCDMAFHDEGIAIHLNSDAAIHLVDVVTDRVLISWPTTNADGSHGDTGFC